MDDPLPPLDPDAGLIRRALDMGDRIVVHVLTAAEALDQHANIAESGYLVGGAFTASAPDEMLVADDGRPIAVHYSPAARQQLDADS